MPGGSYYDENVNSGCNTEKVLPITTESTPIGTTSIEQESMCSVSDIIKNDINTKDLCSSVDSLIESQKSQACASQVQQQESTCCTTNKTKNLKRKCVKEILSTDKDIIKSLKLSTPVYAKNNRDSFKQLLDFHKDMLKLEDFTDEKLQELRFYFLKPHYHACFMITKNTEYDGFPALLLRSISICSKVKNSSKASIRDINHVLVQYELKNLAFEHLIKSHFCVYRTAEAKKIFLILWKYFDIINRSRKPTKAPYSRGEHYRNCASCFLEYHDDNNILVQ